MRLWFLRRVWRNQLASHLPRLHTLLFPLSEWERGLGGAGERFVKCGYSVRICVRTTCELSEPASVLEVFVYLFGKWDAGGWTVGPLIGQQRDRSRGLAGRSVHPIQEDGSFIYPSWHLPASLLTLSSVTPDTRFIIYCLFVCLRGFLIYSSSYSFEIRG